MEGASADDLSYLFRGAHNDFVVPTDLLVLSIPNGTEDGSFRKIIILGYQAAVSDGTLFYAQALQALVHARKVMVEGLLAGPVEDGEVHGWIPT